MTQDQINALKQTSASFRSQATQFNLQADDIDAAIALAENGYQSDQEAIATGIANGVATALASIKTNADALSASITAATPAQS